MSWDRFLSFDHVAAGGSTDLLMGDGAIFQFVGTTKSIANGPGLNPARPCLRMDGGTSFDVLVPSLSTFRFGVRRYTQNYNQQIFAFRSAAGECLNLNRVASGGIQVRRGTTVLGTTSALTANAWTYIEVAIVLDGSAGSCIINFDGVEVLNITDQPTLNVAGPCTTLRFTGSADYAYFTDIYLTDRESFWGPIQMRLLHPTSDVTKEWTRSAGSDNYALVDEATTNSGTDYVETATLDTEDQYGMGDLPAGVNSIIALVVGTVALAPDGGAPLVAHTVEVDATQAVGDGRALSGTGYRTQLTPFMTAPDTSAWSSAKVDSAVIGIKAA